MDKDDAFLDKAIEGLVLFAFNQGEGITCPSRALIQESIYDKFMERVLKRVAAIKHQNPLDTDSMMGAQASKEQLTKILSYLDVGKQEGAEVLAGGNQALGGDLEGGYYVQPTLFKGHNKMRIFQEENLRPRAGRDHLQGRGRSAGDCQRHAVRHGRRCVEPQRQCGLPHGPRDQGRARGPTCYHAYPAHAAFGGQGVGHWA
ncbi:MAG: aldehyde dehydrogenase family protein [Paenacidovorax caeni]